MRSRLVYLASYVFTYLFAWYVLIACGIIGQHIYRWELIIWALALMGWQLAYTFALMASRKWQESSRRFSELYFARLYEDNICIPGQIVIDDTLPDIPKQRGE